MKRIFSIALFALVVAMLPIALVGCGKKKATNLEVVGTWKYDSYYFDENNTKHYFKEKEWENRHFFFHEDNTWDFPSESEEQTWEIKDGKLIATRVYLNNYDPTVHYIFLIKDNELHLIRGDEDNIVYLVFKKVKTPTIN